MPPPAPMKPQMKPMSTPHTTDWMARFWALCVVFTLLWARIAAVFANKADPKTLNRATGVVLVVLGVVIMGFKLVA